MAQSTPSTGTAQGEELPARLRVHALAKLLGTTSKAVLAELTTLGAAVSSAQSSIDRAVAERVRAVLSPAADTPAPAAPEAPAPEAAAPEAPAPAAPSTTAPLFMAPEPVTAPPRRRRASRAAAPAEESAPVLAGTTSPAAETAQPGTTELGNTELGNTESATTGSEQTGGADAPVPEQAPTRGRRRRSSRSSQETPVTDAPADAPAVSVPAAEEQQEPGVDASSDSDDETPRRRRRGRRGRGRGRGADDRAEGTEDDTDEDTEDQPTGAAAASDGSSDDASDDSDTDSTDSTDAEESSDGSGDDEGGDGNGRRRRRRRRRRSSGEGADSGTEDAESGDDPPDTVVHEREPRARRSRSGGRGEGRGDNRGEARGDSDEVQGITGSTRLEAKRQRRRDGRDSGRRRPPILSESEFLARREAVERTMVVREHEGRSQVAVLEDGVLVEHFVTSASSTAMLGNIYVGRVQNVLPSMEAAFIDVGRGRNGVLYAGEVDWDAAGLGGRSRKIEQALHSGDPVLVQVSKDPVGHKGARLTTQISLPGRFLVYVPGGSSTGISRKLPDTERKRLKDILKRIVPAEAGVIIRTASEGISEAELAQDVERLQAQWESISAAATKAMEGPGKLSAPVPLYEEPDLLVKVVRDLFNSDFRSLVVSGEQATGTIESYVGAVAPDLTDRVERHTGDVDVFAAHRIDEQLAKAMDRKVWLPSGGTLVIDRTEAMTVVDVNTGKFTGAGGNLEETVTRNNIEAAEEIVRQMRLRDIGGMIVVDFIDMVLESNRDLVLRRLNECLGRDRTRHQVSEVTSLGLVQMTRKRVGAGLLEEFSTPCEHCQGSGVVVQTEPVEPSSVSSESRSGRSRGGNDRRPDSAPVVLDPGPLVHTTPPRPGPARRVDSPAPVTTDVEEVAADVPSAVVETTPAATVDAAGPAAVEAAPSTPAPRTRARRASRRTSAPEAAEPVVVTVPDAGETSAPVPDAVPDAAVPDAAASEVEAPAVKPKRVRRAATRAAAPAPGTTPEPVVVASPEPAAPGPDAAGPNEPVTAENLSQPGVAPTPEPVRPARRRAVRRPAGAPVDEQD